MDAIVPYKGHEGKRLDRQSIPTMAKSSRDYYHSSRGTTLPPIRDVIGDVLAQPARPRDSSSRDRSATPAPPAHATSPTSPPHFPSMRPPRAIDPSHSGTRMYPSSSKDYRMRSPSPPPPHASRRHEFSSPPPVSSSHSSSVTDYRMHSPSPRPMSRAAQRPEYSHTSSTSRSHSYDVFVATSDQGLVHKQSSTNDDFHHVTKEDVIANSTGKHVCAECQRRFEKLSTLKNHLTTHSGERPHECPDCGKSFSVYTNMRRHQLIHRRSGTSD